MKLIRFARRRHFAWGIVTGDWVRILSEPPFSRVRYCGDRVRRKTLRLVVPAEPHTIVLVGLNYRAHARELQLPVPREPVIFIKPVTTLCAPGQPIVYPSGVGRVDYEAELALIIKKTCRHVSERDAPQHILGYTCLNDVTARDLQTKDGQWTRAKSFDTFCPVGPWVETECDLRRARVRSYVNGALRQDAGIADFIFSVPRLVAFISSVMTLHPGDIIATGTPPGVGPLAPGDHVEIEVTGVGRLCNPVRRSPGAGR